MPFALELYYLIIDQVLLEELQHYQHVFAPSTHSTVLQLLLCNGTFHEYIRQQDRFHRLRLSRLLNRIPRQFEPVQVAVGTPDCFTVLSMDMSSEKITMPASYARQETFLVLQESTASIRNYWASASLQTVYTKPDRDSFAMPSTSRAAAKRRTRQKRASKRRQADGTTDTSPATSADQLDAVSGCGAFLKSSYPRKWGYNSSNKDDEQDDDIVDDLNDRVAVALFPLDTFIRHVQWYAMLHNASVWLWKRSARFFRGDNLDTLQNQEFRYILDTTRHALIAWDRPNRSNIRFTESVLNSNVELFSKLLPAN